MRSLWARLARSEQHSPPSRPKNFQFRDLSTRKPSRQRAPIIDTLATLLNTAQDAHLHAMLFAGSFSRHDLLFRELFLLPSNRDQTSKTSSHSLRMPFCSYQASNIRLTICVSKEGRREGAAMLSSLSFLLLPLSDFSPSSLLFLSQNTCNDFADPYVEQPPLLLFLDLVLLRPGVYRHLLFNRGTEPIQAGRVLVEEKPTGAESLPESRSNVSVGVGRWKVSS